MVFIKINDKITTLIEFYKKQTVDQTYSGSLTQKNNTITLKNLRTIFEKYQELKQTLTPDSGVSEIPETLKQLFSYSDIIYTLDQRIEIRELELDPEALRLRKYLEKKAVEREYFTAMNRGRSTKNNWFGVNQESDAERASNIAKEFESSVSFAMTFIVGIFSGALMGYFLGEYAFGFDFHGVIYFGVKNNSG
jgi:hypothetical protein